LIDNPVLGKLEIWVINGKNTANLGVIGWERFPGASVTDIERTLIDMAVRPAYSGGPKEVLAAFRNLVKRASVKRIVDYLRNLKYTYPYYQSVGFYLERSGVGNPELEEVKSSFHSMKFDFYIDNQIQNPKYCSDWRIYYPELLDLPPEG
jgi:predicted transcriptional regulator of viral defense system